MSQQHDVTRLSLPPGFTARAPLLEDVEAVTEIINHSSLEDVGAPSIGVADVKAWWTSPSFELARDAVFVSTEAGEPAAYVDFEVIADGRKFFFDGYVRPGFRERGLGTFLVDAAQRGALARLADRLERDAVSLGTSCHAADAAACRLFERHGLHEVRRSYRMVADLRQGGGEVAATPGISISRYAPGDDRALYDSHTEGFADHWNFSPRPFETWLWHLTKQEGYDPSLVFVARDGEEIAGGAICTVDPEDASRGFVSDLWVRPAWRRRGIALALLLHAFAEFRRRGLESAALSVDAQSTTGALELYARAGMRPVRESISFEKHLRGGGA